MRKSNLIIFLLIGGNGTGKTVMLDAFATNTAKKQAEEKVIFAIQQYFSDARPLLHLDLEAKYEKMKLRNITVNSFTKISDLNVANLTNSTLCIDEIEMGNITPDDLNGLNAKSIWIVIRDTDPEEGIRLTPTREETPEEYLRNKFPGWVIVNLSYPLRTSKTLSEEVKNGDVGLQLHTNNFNGSLQVPPNMPVGPKPLILPKSEGSYHARLKHAFSAVGKDKPVLIILNSYSMEPTLEEIQEAKRTTLHQRLAEKSDEISQNILVGIEAVKACQRPHPPLLWFRSDYAYVSDTKEDIKEGMKGRNRNFTGRDLITDPECVAGYEADLVIYLTAYGSRYVSAMMSRCRGQFVHIE